MTQKPELITGENLVKIFSKNQDALHFFASRLSEMTEQKRNELGAVLADQKYREVTDQTLQFINALIREHQAAAIYEDKKMISFGGFVEWGPPTKEGRKIYMITKVATDPAYENRGHGKQIMTRLTEMIRSMDPQARILVVSKNPLIQRQFQNLPDWKKTTTLAIRKSKDIYSDDLDPSEEKALMNDIDQGYEAFLFDPV